MATAMEVAPKQFEKFKGTFVISNNRVYRWIGVVQDSNDIYYALYDGIDIHYHSCVMRLVFLKGYIEEEDYQEFIRLAKLNHSDQAEAWFNPDLSKESMDEYIKELTTIEDKWILGPYLNLE